MGILETEDAAWLRALATRQRPAPRVFVETGTGHGVLTRLALAQFARVHTVELSPELVALHHTDLRALGAITYEGDSATVVPRLAAELTEPVMWYLDAHWWPDGGPLVAYSELPLWAELTAIAARAYPDIVVVDDVNCFGRGPQPAWADISPERVGALFPDALEVVVLGDQLAVYR